MLVRNDQALVAQAMQLDDFTRHAEQRTLQGPNPVGSIHGHQEIPDLHFLDVLVRPVGHQHAIASQETGRLRAVGCLTEVRQSAIGWLGAVRSDRDRPPLFLIPLGIPPANERFLSFDKKLT
ncbi:hypothetical protein D3C71_1526810 [compost metagenome]